MGPTDLRLITFLDFSMLIRASTIGVSPEASQEIGQGKAGPRNIEFQQLWSARNSPGAAGAAGAQRPCGQVALDTGPLAVLPRAAQSL
jgi:hypothetical protein